MPRQSDRSEKRLSSSGRDVCSRVGSSLLSVIRSDRGVSALEFALIAPVLVIALLGTVDVGRALTEQMAIGSLLRTGAEHLIAGDDASAVRQTLDSAKEDAAVSVDVRQFCACPESPQTAVECSVTCAGSEATGVYYSLTASKTFSGMLMPTIPLSRSLQVQVR